MSQWPAPESGGHLGSSSVRGLSTGACAEGEGRARFVLAERWHTCGKGGVGGYRESPEDVEAHWGQCPGEWWAFGARQALTPT